MNFLSHYWRKKLIGDIKHQRLLFLALFFLCIFGVGSYVTLTMGYTNLYSSLDKIYAKTNFAEVEINTHSDVWYNISDINSFTLNYSQNNPGIKMINYRLVIASGYNSSFGTKENARYQLTEGRAIGINWSLTQTERVNGFIYEEGPVPTSEPINNSILLEAHYAHSYDLHANDSLQTKIYGQKFNFTIQNIVYNPEALLVIPSRSEFLPNNRFGIIYLPLETLQGYTNLTGLANNIIIKISDHLSLEGRNLLFSDFYTKLNDYANNSFVPPVYQEHQVSNWAINMDLEEIQKIAIVLPILVLGVASIAIFITLNRQVQSQRRIIGIASSLGYTPTDILLHYASFSLILGLVGSTIGIILGTFLSGGITWIYAYFMNFPTIISIEIQFGVIFIAFLIGTTITFISGIIPAIKANRLSPREALQGSLVISKGNFSFFERFFGIKSFRIRLTVPLRNFFRQKSRTSATIIAISASVMILVVSGAFNDSINGGISRQFTETSQYHISVNYEGFKFTDLGLNEDLAYISQLPGVESIDPVLEIPSIIEINGRKEEVLIMAWNTSSPQTHMFQWTSSKDEFLQKRSLILTSGLARTLGASTGSVVSYGYPRIPYLSYAFDAATSIWNLWGGGERGRNETLEYLTSLINQNKESLSFSTNAEEITFRYKDITVTGVSEEIWGSIVYTTISTLTDVMNIDMFKDSFLDIDLSPCSKLILKIEDPNNLTLLENIKAEISNLENIRSITFGYDLRTSINLTLTAFNIIVLIFIIFACILAGASIFTTIHVNFQERSRESATMLTLGLSDLEFLFIISIENFFQTIFGILGGILPGLWLADWILSNALRLFYFPIRVSLQTWIILWVGVLLIVLISQIPAIIQGVKMDLAEVTKDISQ
ncbi:MAG: ABC transporter permease [Candidatus Hodarchaeales archaeon]|jgi:putative ABC transport system permease protein